MSRVIVEDGPLAAMLDSLQAFARRLMDKELSVDLGSTPRGGAGAGGSARAQRRGVGGRLRARPGRVRIGC